MRLVATTSRDLEDLVAEGAFREDLYYRLAVVRLRVPALRERREDVEPLVRHFLQRQADRAGRSPLAITDAALARLAGLEWPGNVRQLRNLLEAASVFAGNGPIQPEHLEEVLANGPSLSPGHGAASSALDPFQAPTFEEFKNLSEALFIQRRLQDNEGNVKRTAEQLGMQRSHLYKKLERYGLR